MKCRTPISGENTSCKLSPWEIICMKCQTPFSGKNKNISKCAEIFTWHATHFLFRYTRKQTGSHRSCLPLSQMAMCPAKILISLHISYSLIRIKDSQGCKIFLYLGPVVQSVVNLTSLLRVISLTVLADSVHKIPIFFAEKM